MQVESEPVFLANTKSRPNITPSSVEFHMRFHSGVAERSTYPFIIKVKADKAHKNQVLADS